MNGDNPYLDRKDIQDLTEAVRSLTRAIHTVLSPNEREMTKELKALRKDFEKILKRKADR
jgi:ElaB/YqjD/DUF883 family membrane-anchored ribosome-binding protein